MLGLKLAFIALAASAASSPKIAVSRPLPALVRIGQTVTVKGRVRHARSNASLALQGRGADATWTAVATARASRRGRFSIHWTVPSSERIGPLSLRVAELSRDRVIARTGATQSAVGPAPVYCTAPVPPAVDIPVGDGWIVGGLYLEGGAFPGILQCEQQAYTIRALTSTGTVAASMQVAGGHSYTLVVPAGSYTLRASTCGFGSATVKPGKGTTANTYCPVP
jgi:hypothetical protein